MWFGKFMKSGWAKRDADVVSQPDEVIIDAETATVQWQSNNPVADNDTVFGGRDWTDLSVLVDRDTPLGRAVRKGQCYFTDQELNDAIQGKSRTVILTTVDNEPVFLNAAMMSDIMTGETIEPIAA